MAWKTLLYATHRWLGIGMCLLFALWFASGIIMMYVEYPELTHAERVQSLQALDREAVRLDPFAAAGKLGPVSAYRSLDLSMLLGRPAYHFTTVNGERATVFADTGERFKGFDRASAVRAAQMSGLAPEHTDPEHAGLIEMDQWTVTASLDPFRPLHKVVLGDAADTVLYISEVTGQVVRDSDGRERFWNWLGSTVHWIYPMQLRRHTNVWVQLIIYLSLIGLVSIVTGAIIGFMRLRLKKRYRGKTVSPYRGMMKWHHLLGLGCLLFVFTFTFSGLMSMGPWGIFQSPTSAAAQISRYQGQDVLRLSSLPVLRENYAVPVKEVTWHYLAGQPYAVVLLADNGRRVAFGAALSGKENAQDRLGALLRKATPALLPEAELLDLELLDGYDNYYYSRHNRFRPLPVYRARFNDPENTWYHLDARTGEVISRVTDRSRLERWLFNGLHSLDFQWLWQQRPLWDIVVILLSLLGLVFSVTSVIIGWRRLVR